jgi:hypothetical protein
LPIWNLCVKKLAINSNKSSNNPFEKKLRQKIYVHRRTSHALESCEAKEAINKPKARRS